MLKKKIAMLILPLIVCALVFICNGEKMFVTASSGTTGDCEWVLEDGVLMIKGEGTMGDYTYSSPAPWGEEITAVVIEEGVTSIGNYAFYKCSSLTSIELPEGVTSIRDYAFYKCSSLTSIELPEGITSIGSGTFSYCSSLTSIELPEGITSIGDDAFSSCSSLTSIELPEGITSIGRYAFSSCSSLTSIELPEGVTSIRDYAFYECSSLTSIELPEGITSIGSGTFSGCSSLTSIELPEGVTSIRDYAFYHCSSLTSIELPEGITSIGSGTFYYCSSLTSIELPEGVTSIGNHAFYHCSSLTSIELPEGVTSIGDDAFSYCSSLTSIELPEGITSIGECAFSSCSSLTSIELPEGITSIGNYAFSSCSSLTSIELPEGITSIGECAFSSCSSLTSIELPEGITSIGNYAFSSCSSLTSIELPEGITSIGGGTFSSCSSLTSIELPEGVTSIGNYAFSECSSLTSIELPEGITSIGSGTFSYCSSLTSIELPEGITSIGDRAFSSCSSLTSIELPEGITSIGNYAFSFCSSLTSIELLEGVTSIGEWAFYDCSSLTSIELPEGITSIGSGTFCHCSSLTSIELPEGVTSIGDYAFSYCSSLTSIELPEGITSIGSGTFSFCSSLTSIELPEGVTSIGSRAFYDCQNLNQIIIPRTVMQIESDAFEAAYNMSIHGYIGSYADEFANSNDIVFVPIDGPKLDVAEKKLYVSEGYQLIVTVDSPNCTGETVWSSSNEAVAIVTQEGYVQAISEGIAIITVKVGNYAVSCTVTVEERKNGDCTWTLEDGVLTISGEGMMGDYSDSSPAPWGTSITKVIIEEGVRRIGNSAFSGCSNLTSIDIPEGITSIGDDAFYNCSSLTSIELPEGVTSIGNYAFRGCSSLTSIELPEGVTSIGHHAFSYCSSLTSIELPEGITIIERYAFSYCSSLTSIELPEGVTSIGDYAFYNCSSLTSIELPEGITSIGSGTFCHCSSLTSIELPEGVTSIGDYAFYNCSSLTSIELPEGITSIGSGTFSFCSSLTSIELPEGVTSIGSLAFYMCDSLKSIEIPSSVTFIEDDAFGFCSSAIIYGYIGSYADEFANSNDFVFVAIDGPKLDVAEKKLYVSEGYQLNVTVDSPNCTGEVVWSSSNEAVATVTQEGYVQAISEGIAIITVKVGNYAVSCTVTVEERKTGDCMWTLEDGVLTISGEGMMGDYSDSSPAPWGTSITKVIIEEGVRRIGNSAFSYCINLTSIELPQGVWYIGHEAFAYCTNLTKIFIPNSTYYIEDDAFEGSESVVIYGDNGSSAEEFANRKGITFLYPAKWVMLNREGMVLYEEEGYQLYVTIEPSNCTDEVVWSSSNEAVATVTQDGYVQAISEGTAIITVTVGDCSASCALTVYVQLKEGKTGECTWVFENGVLTISGNGEMENYTYSYPESPAPWGAAITKVVIEEGVTSIGDYAFFGCSSLTSVELPEGLTSIGNNAFAYCYRLTSIELPDSLTSIGSGAFFGYGGTTIELPEGLTSIGNSAFCYSSLTSIKIPRGITNIESDTFWGCYDLISIELPEGLTSIGNGAFYECISLTSIEIPSSVTFIGDDAFCYCSNAIIYGYTGSYAEEYAMTNGISFVSIDEKPTAVSLDITEKSIELPGTFQLSVTVEPTECALPPVWSSSNEAVATVTQDGYVTAVGEGTAIITVTVGDLTATCTVVVTLSPEDAWEQVVEEAVSAIEEAQAGDSVEIDMKLGEDVASTVPEEVLEAARGKDVEVVLDFGDYKWSVNGENITAEEVGDVSLEVELDSNAINESLVGEVAGNDDSIQISLVHDGDFGFRASLTLNVGTENAGQYGTLYYYNGEGELEYVSSELIDEDGNVVFTFSHASDYVIVIGEERDAEEEIENPFKDVQEGQYYYKPVLWAVENSITAGLSATEFGPNETCTRAQIVTFLWRAAGRPEVTTAINPFTDVPSDAYYTKAVLWAVEKGITAGLSATEFGPGETCTRAQIVAFLWRAFGKQEPTTTTNPFTDVPANAYYAKAVLWAVENNITAGLSSTKFGPEAACTRGQVVSFLYRAYAK